MVPRTSEQGQAAVAVIGVLLLLVLGAVGAGVGLRASLTRQRAAGTADGAALAAAAVLRDRAGDLLPRYDERARRTLPPRLTRAELDVLARAAAEHAAAVGGAELVAFRTSDGARGLPMYASATVRVPATTLPRWLGSSTLQSLRTGRARAGLDYPLPALEPDLFRPVDLGGVAGISAVIAAASAQLGWPYTWGGESRAEGGFDCSGLIDYALAAAGFPVGRPTAAGLQALTEPVPLAAARGGDLVFVGDPAHHVGLVVRPGLAIEAPHRGAFVHYEPMRAGRVDIGRPSRRTRASAIGGRDASRLGPRRVPRRARRGKSRGGHPGGAACRADRGRERLRPSFGARDPARSGSRSSCRRRGPGHGIHGGRGARSIRPQRSTHRRATCVASSIAPTATSPARLPRTTTAGTGARGGPGRP